jgi:hypothetical protein
MHSAFAAAATRCFPLVQRCQLHQSLHDFHMLNHWFNPERGGFTVLLREVTHVA